MEDCVIQIRNLNKKFKAKSGEVAALIDVSLDVRRGEILGVMGFSGAGKSTLVRCINLLEKPDSGEVLFGGRDIAKLKERKLKNVRRKIGMIFQSFNLFDRSTVFENIAYPLRYTRMPRAEITRRVDELLKIVDLTDKREAYPSQLSGGQKQRVAIARALANNPEILLSDEATSALDPDATQSILQLLKDVNRRLGVTIVIITHEMAVVKQICDRVAVMEKGRIVEEGTVLEIFSDPGQEITKNFVGSASSLGKVEKLLESGCPVLDSGDGLLLKLSFKSEDGTAALFDAAKKYKVDFKIVLANVEAIADRSVGGLIVVLKGPDEAVKKTLDYLAEKEVNAEVIKNERAV